MARPLRIEHDGALYHVTSRGNDPKPIFKDDSDRELFLSTLIQPNGARDVWGRPPLRRCEGILKMVNAAGDQSGNADRIPLLEVFQMFPLMLQMSLARMSCIWVPHMSQVSTSEWTDISISPADHDRLMKFRNRAPLSRIFKNRKFSPGPLWGPIPACYDRTAGTFGCAGRGEDPAFRVVGPKERASKHFG